MPTGISVADVVVLEDIIVWESDALRRREPAKIGKKDIMLVVGGDGLKSRRRVVAVGWHGMAVGGWLEELL